MVITGYPICRVHLSIMPPMSMSRPSERMAWTETPHLNVDASFNLTEKGFKITNSKTAVSHITMETSLYPSCWINNSTRSAFEPHRRVSPERVCSTGRLWRRYHTCDSADNPENPEGWSIHRDQTHETGNDTTEKTDHITSCDCHPCVKGSYNHVGSPPAVIVVDA